MAMADSGRKITGDGEEEDFWGSALQLRLAVSALNRRVERNGGCGAVDVFFDEDSVDAELDQDEYLDPELWDPDADPVPDMAAEIAENIFECL